MSRNEVFFSLNDGEIIDTPPAPEAPATGMANIVGEATVSTDESWKEQVSKDLADPSNDYPQDEWSEPELYVPAQEYKRARRFHADTPFVLGLLLFLVAGMAGASFYVSFSGLYAAAEWAVGPNPPLQFAVPIMLDIAIIAFTLALFVERERGEKVVGTWIAIAMFAAVSATANILHTFVVSTATDNYQLLVGAVISGGAPILLAFATDKIAIKVFKSADPVTK